MAGIESKIVRLCCKQILAKSWLSPHAIFRQDFQQSMAVAVEKSTQAPPSHHQPFSPNLQEHLHNLQDQSALPMPQSIQLQWDHLGNTLWQHCRTNLSLVRALSSTTEFLEQSANWWLELQHSQRQDPLIILLRPPLLLLSLARFRYGQANQSLYLPIYHEGVVRIHRSRLQ